MDRTLLYSILILFFTLAMPFQSRKISKSLLKVCPDYSGLKKKYDADFKKQKATKAYEADVKNVELLGKAILSKQKPIASGAFGSVFKIEGVSYEDVDDEMTLAMKEVKFNNDYESSDGKTYQDLVQTEIQIMQGINAIDPENVFFPKCYGAYNVTGRFKELYKTKQIRDLQQFMYDPYERTDFMIMVFEFNDLSLNAYQDQIYQKKINSNFLTRLRIFFNLGFGLNEIYGKYTHCDLKPENVMFKKIDEEYANELESDHSAEVLQLFPNEFYQLQVIDFGLATMGPLEERICPGGTPGYLTLEYAKGQKQGKNLDNYAVAMMMIDFELIALGIGPINDLLGLCYQLIRHIYKNRLNNCSIQNSDALNKIRTQPFMSHLRTMLFKSKDPEFKQKYFGTIKSFLTDRHYEEVMEFFDFEKIQNRNAEDIYKKNVFFLRAMILATVHTIWNVTYKDEILKKKVEKLDEYIQQKQTELDSMDEGEGEGESVERSQATELKEYYEKMKALEVDLADTKIGLINYLLDYVLGMTARPDLVDFMQYIESIVDEVSSEHWDKWSFTTMIGNHYKITNLYEMKIPEMSLEDIAKNISGGHGTINHINPNYRLMI